MDSMKVSRVESRGQAIHHYLTGVIKDPDAYIGLIADLETAAPDDIIYIHINCDGGCLNTTAQILHAMQSTQGEVIASAEGMVASAASLIFFAANGMVVGDFSTFLLHDGTEGNVGKVNDNFDAAIASKGWLTRLYNKIYSPFFKKKEIKKVLEGKEWYLTPDEVKVRLEKAFEENNIED